MSHVIQSLMHRYLCLSPHFVELSNIHCTSPAQIRTLSLNTYEYFNWAQTTFMDLALPAIFVDEFFIHIICTPISQRRIIPRTKKIIPNPSKCHLAFRIFFTEFIQLGFFPLKRVYLNFNFCFAIIFFFWQIFLTKKPTGILKLLWNKLEYWKMTVVTKLQNFLQN